MPDSPSLGVWLSESGTRGFKFEDERTVASVSNGECYMRSPPPPGVTVRIGPTNGDIVFRLDEAVLDRLVVDAKHLVSLGGTGSIVHVEVISGPAIFFQSVTVADLEVASNSQFELRTIEGAEVQKVTIGDQIFDPRLESAIGEVHVVGGVLTLKASELTTQKLTTDVDVLTVASGTVSIREHCHRHVCLLGATALVLGGEVAHVGLSVTMHDAILRVTGSTTMAERLKLTGTDARLEAVGSRIVGVSLETEAATVVLKEGAEVIEANGEFSLVSHDNSSISAGDGLGLTLTNVEVSQASTVEGIDFFRLDPSLVANLEGARRVSGRWPRDRRARLNQARSIDAGVRLPASRLVARAHYWSTVERLLASKNAGGNDLVAAHELAQDARRLAAPPWSAERLLLEISRCTAYATRVVAPIAMWFVIAVVVAMVVRSVTTGVTWGKNWEDGALLAWDVVVSPLTWVRPLNEGSDLGRLTAGHFLGTVVAFVGRVVGTYLPLRESWWRTLAVTARR